MSEKLYALLLHIYPARFRSGYGTEAMQVFRDRLRDERGMMKRARLWMDMLLDLTLSAPREHRRAGATPASISTGLPSFPVLEEEPLRLDMFLGGALLAFVALATFGFLLTHGGNRVLLPAISNEPLRSPAGRAIAAGKTGERPVASSTADPAQLSILLAEHQLVIREVIQTVSQHDPRPAEAQAVARMLHRHENSGDYDQIASGLLFAHLLTEQIAAVTKEAAVTVIWNEHPLAGSSLSLPAGATSRTIDNHFSVTLVPATDR